MKIVDLNKDEQDGIFALIYGASGTGKTHLVGTLGELGRVLVIDIDKGYKTIKFAKDLQSFRNNITIVDFKAFEDLDRAYRLVDKNDPSEWSKSFGFEVSQPFDWIVWDTWSEIQWWLQKGLRDKQADQLLNKGSERDKLTYRPNFQIQHWGMITDLNKLAIEQLRECSVNQVFTMQEKLDKDELSGATYGGPAIHGKMVQEMPVYFDIVARTYTALDGSFMATTRAKGKWPAKSRLGEGMEYKNPTAKQLFKK